MTSFINRSKTFFGPFNLHRVVTALAWVITTSLLLYPILIDDKIDGDGARLPRKKKLYFSVMLASHPNKASL